MSVKKSGEKQTIYSDNKKRFSAVREKNTKENQREMRYNNTAEKTHKQPVKRTTDRWANHFTLPRFKIYPYPPYSHPIL